MQNHKRRAWVTGLGMLTPIGSNKDALLKAIKRTSSGIRPIEAFDLSNFRVKYGGELVDFRPEEDLSADERLQYRDKYIQMAISTAKKALTNAGLSPLNVDRTRVGIVVGTCNGGIQTAERHYEKLMENPGHEATQHEILQMRYYALGKALAHSLSVHGPTWVVTTACSSSTGALGIALELIEHGDVDILIVGGCDALCRTTLAGFDTLRATSATRTAPFSTPVGLNLGEGAAFWVVEESEHAKARGADASGEILGYALTADAHHPTSPDPRGDGALRTMKNAISRSGLDMGDIGCINAHGTGTEANDRVESRAISKLGADPELPIYSFKSQVGHCLGAAGIIEATAGLVAMNAGVVPATINFNEKRPGCNLNYVPNAPIEKSYPAFISCNYAFGGNNAGVVISQRNAQRDQEIKTGIQKERTVLTGGGVVTSLGIGTSVNLRRLANKERGLTSVAPRLKESTKAKLCGLITDFEPRKVDRRIDFRSMKPISEYATVAAKLALADGGLRVSPKSGMETGVVNGVCVGPPEEEFVDAVVRGNMQNADVGDFSHIVANATGGWVSNALALKGYSSTIAQGPDAGIFAILMAHFALSSNGAVRVLAGASDAIYNRYYLDFDIAGLLHRGAREEAYGLNLDVPHKRVLAEGAAYVLAETLDGALKRGQTPIAELMGYGMTTDGDAFKGACVKYDTLSVSIDNALKSAFWERSDVGLILWSPQGNSHDKKLISAVEQVFGPNGDHPPLVTTVFNTGYMESASGTVSVANLLEAWKTGTAVWPQITGSDQYDTAPLPEKPVNTLVVVSSDVGFNLALALAPYRSEATP